MKTQANKRVVIVIGLLCLATATVAPLWLKRDHLPPPDSKGSNTAATVNESHSQTKRPTSSREPFRIISEQVTATGSLFTVAKGGQRTNVFLPSTMRGTAELLEAIAFGQNEEPKSTQRPDDITNPHLYFYGLVVDERTNALVGANIEALVQTYDGKSLAWRETRQLISEADGRFTVDVPRGQSMILKVSKRPDYIDYPAQRFEYGFVHRSLRHVPKALEPVTFILHKLKPFEPLFSFAQNYRTPNSGEPVRLDLAIGKLVKEGGDLIVSIHCPEPYTNLKPFPWRLSVMAENGGFVEIQSSPAEPVRSEYLHEAPDAGYTPRFTKEYGPNATDFDRQFDGWFYVRSRNGQIYSKMYFRMNTFWDERGVPFRIEAVVNTNASRNLQTPIGQ